eukprot:1402033-Pyramimonas_sp.AAC.2
MIQYPNIPFRYGVLNLIREPSGDLGSYVWALWGSSVLGFWDLGVGSYHVGILDLGIIGFWDHLGSWVLPSWDLGSWDLGL